MEEFRYKVVYPGGTYIRVSPSLDSERTGDIIEYGVVFAASKSLVLDGINYVKLADKRGWVFGNKGDTEVLELVEVVRVPGGGTGVIEGFSVPTLVTASGKGNKGAESVSADGCHSQSKSEASKAPSLVTHSATATALEADSHLTVLRAAKEKEKLFQKVRADNRYWREVGSKVLSCESFDVFVALSVEVAAESRGVGWAGGRPQDAQIRHLISLLVSITSQCAPEVADLTALDAALWVLVHLGPRCSHAVQLAVSAANDRYEWLDEERQDELLCAVLEIGLRTKQHTLDLCKLVDVLADDIKNFLQRWLIIRSFDIEYVFVEGEGEEEGKDDTDSRHRVAATPNTASLAAGGNAQSWLGRGLPAWLCGTGGPSPFKGRRGKGGRPRGLPLPLPRGARDRGREDPDSMFAPDEDAESEGQAQRQDEQEPFWSGLRRRVQELISDPDLQLAGII